MSSQTPETEGQSLPAALDLPILAIRNTVIFPVLAFPINVGREKSLEAVEQALQKDKLLGILAQRDAKNDNPDVDELYGTGTVVKILKSVKMPGNKLSVIIQGLARIKVTDWKHTDPFLRAQVDVFEERADHPRELEGPMTSLRELAQRIIDLSPQIPSEASFLVRSIDNPGVLADIVASNLGIGVEEKQDLLDTFDTARRIEKVIALLNKEIHVLELSNKIQSEVKGEMDKAQREYFLREQLKAIQKELGEVDERQEEFEELKKGIKKARMPKEVEKIAFKELKRMSRMSPGAAEYTVSRTYLDWLIELPWSITTKDKLEVDEAARSSTRITRPREGEAADPRVPRGPKLKQDMKGPILCLVGPPGAQDLARESVARARRRMVRISLGGVRDGQRSAVTPDTSARSPARSSGLKRPARNNPVFVLDRDRQARHDYRGDPASALLRFLDPEQNDTFMDHYLDVAFDLSKVLFIATANLAERSRRSATAWSSSRSPATRWKTRSRSRGTSSFPKCSTTTVSRTR
jgi:ATP-dependent Lon protease